MRQEMYKMILEHLIIPERKNAMNENRVSNECGSKLEAPIEQRHMI